MALDVQYSAVPTDGVGDGPHPDLAFSLQYPDVVDDFGGTVVAELRRFLRSSRFRRFGFKVIETVGEPGSDRPRASSGPGRKWTWPNAR
jgi:hypothetical protein